MPRKQTQPKPTTAEKFWTSPDRIAGGSDVRGQELVCDTCRQHDAVLQAWIKYDGVVKIYMNLCPNCCNEVEATFRMFRKWSIRGGALA